MLYHKIGKNWYIRTDDNKTVPFAPRFRAKEEAINWKRRNKEKIENWLASNN